MKKLVMSGLAVAAFTMIAAVTHADETTFIAPDDAINQDPIETSIASEETSTQFVSDGDQEERARPDRRRGRRGPDASGRRGPDGSPGAGFRGQISNEQRERIREMMARRFGGDSEKANEFREKMRERFQGQTQARDGRGVPPWVRGDRPDRGGPPKVKPQGKRPERPQARKDSRRGRPDKEGPKGVAGRGKKRPDKAGRPNRGPSDRHVRRGPPRDGKRPEGMRRGPKDRRVASVKGPQGPQGRGRSLKNKPPRKKNGGGASELRQEIRELRKSIEQLSEKLDQQSA